MIEEWFDSLSGQDTSTERSNRLCGHWGGDRRADAKISGWNYTATLSCLPGVHGNDFAYPSCFDRVYRGCLQTLQAKKKKKMFSTEVRLLPCPYTSHPFRLRPCPYTSHPFRLRPYTSHSCRLGPCPYTSLTFRLRPYTSHPSRLLPCPYTSNPFRLWPCPYTSIHLGNGRVLTHPIHLCYGRTHSIHLGYGRTHPIHLGYGRVVTHPIYLGNGRVLTHPIHLGHGRVLTHPIHLGNGRVLTHSIHLGYGRVLTHPLHLGYDRVLTHPIHLGYGRVLTHPIHLGYGRLLTHPIHLGYGRLLTHPIHVTVMQSFDAMWCGEITAHTHTHTHTHTVEWVHSAVCKYGPCLSVGRRRVRKLRKATSGFMSNRPSVCLSTWNYSSPTVWFFLWNLKFEDFFSKNLSRKLLS
jgi:hypothetical protein